MKPIKSILLLDDDVKVASELSKLLTENGFETWHAKSADQFKNLLQANEPSMVLLDLSLSNSEFEQPGINLFETIRERWRSIPVIAYSPFPVVPTERLEELQPIIWLDKSSALNRSQGDLIRIFEEILESARERPPENEDLATTNKEATSSYLSVSLRQIDILLYKELQRNEELLKSLDWRVFEHLLADMLETFGYEVELMQGTKDGGVDVVAFGKSDLLGEHKYLLQAKRWKRSVGIEPVQRLLFVASQDRATKACLATTSRFVSLPRLPPRVTRNFRFLG